MRVLTLLTIALGVSLTRFIPFMFMKDAKSLDKYQGVLDGIPYASISLLVVYAFKDVNTSNLVASVLGSIVCAGLYLWKRNTILSITISTLLYMILIQNF